jgi:hypothetical protein
MLAHGHSRAGARSTTRLRPNLQDAAVQADGVVARYHARFFVTQDPVEIRLAQGHEGTRRIARGPREHGVVLRDELIREIPVGRLERGNGGHTELVREPILERAIEPLTAAARLRRIGRDVLDAQGRKARPTWVRCVLSTAPLAFGV